MPEGLQVQVPPGTVLRLLYDENTRQKRGGKRYADDDRQFRTG